MTSAKEIGDMAFTELLAHGKSLSRPPPAMTVEILVPEDVDAETLRMARESGFVPRLEMMG